MSLSRDSIPENSAPGYPEPLSPSFSEEGNEPYSYDPDEGTDPGVVAEKLLGLKTGGSTRTAVTGSSRLYGSDDIKRISTEFPANESRGGARGFGRQSRATMDVRSHVHSVLRNIEGVERPHVLRNTVIAYVFCASLIILLSTAGQIVIQVSTSKAYKDSYVVNVAGRQRMFSQMLTKDALAITAGRSAGQNVSYYVAEMAEKVGLWAQVEFGLWHGDSGLGLPGAYNEQLSSAFDALNPRFVAMRNACHVILSLNPETVVLGSPDFSHLERQVSVLLSQEGPYWRGMNDITEEFQTLATNHLEFVNLLTWTLHAGMVGVLILEGILIFRPILRRLQAVVNEGFHLLRQALESEASSLGYSSLLMTYASHQLGLTLTFLTEHHLAATDCHLVPPDASHVAPRHGREGAAAELAEQCQVACSLIGTVTGDIAVLGDVDLGRMMLSVEYVHIGKVMHEVASFARPGRQKEVSLDVDASLEVTESPHRHVDKHRLQQILLTLLHHAFLVTPSGYIRLRVRIPTPPPSGSSAGGGGWGQRLRFEVEDGGGVRSEEEMETAFEPVFKQNKGEGGAEVRGQMGMGFYFVKVLVELQGGTCGIISTGGERSIFWFEIPAPTMLTSQTWRVPSHKS